METFLTLQRTLHFGGPQKKNSAQSSQPCLQHFHKPVYSPELERNTPQWRFLLTVKARGKNPHSLWKDRAEKEWGGTWEFSKKPIIICHSEKPAQRACPRGFTDKKLF